MLALKDAFKPVPKRLGLLFWLAASLSWVLLSPNAATGDQKKLEKLRRFYKSHNLDFFGDLIADQSSFLDDEKRHAKLELLADDARTKALAQLDSLLPRAKGGMIAELLIRKATLLSDRARTANYFLNNPFKTSRLKHPQAYLDGSIKVFREVETKFPGHPQMDVVIFSIGYNYGELKDTKNAYKYYERLVSKFPESPLVGDARLAMAEILFDDRKFNEALGQLKEIVKADHPRLKNFALYKMAWTYYNMSDLDSAILSLEKVIDGVNTAGVQRARLELRKEALGDLVAFYAELPNANAPNEAFVYFEKIGRTPPAIAQEYSAAREKRIAALTAKKTAIPEEETSAYQVSEPLELLLRLTNVYRDQGKHQNAMVIADQLLGALGQHPRAPLLYRLRAESAEKMRRRDLVLAELERFAKVAETDLRAIPAYSDDLPQAEHASTAELFANEYSHEKVNASKVPVVAFKQAPSAKLPDNHIEPEDYYRKRLSKISFDTLKEFSAFLHGEWSKTQNLVTAKQALTLYDLAIRAFLTPWRGHSLDESFELRSRRAGLRHALKQWQNAADDYRWLAWHHGSGEKQDDAIRGEIASLEALSKESNIAIKPGAMHPIHEKLSKAYDFFLALHLANPKMRETSSNILATSARLHREYGQEQDALARMVFYSRYFNDQKDAVALTRDALVLLEKQSRWEELLSFSGSLIESGRYSKTDLKKELLRTNEYSNLKLLEKLETGQDWKSAAKEFAKFAEKHPESNFVSQALMKSANAALQIEDTELALQRLEKASKAPDEKVRMQALLALEPFYRKAYLWDKLIELYSALFRFKLDPKLKQESSKNLAAIHELEKNSFVKQAGNLLKDDPDLEALTITQANFEKTAQAFKQLRFVKSNNNPAQNFKKKTDLHAKLVSTLEKMNEKVPRALKGSGVIWTNLVKAELLIELAETLDTAAVPQALLNATEIDRKAYRETISGQTKELREQARQMALETAKLMSEIESPLDLDARVNKLLEHFGEKTRVVRESLAKIWGARPQIKTSEHSQKKEEEIYEIGLEILGSKSPSEKGEHSYELARKYFEMGEPGYAYAISQVLAAQASSEWAEKAKRLQFEINSNLVHPKVSKQIEADQVDPKLRWQLAKWFSAPTQQSAGFSESEIEWFKRAIQVLLRVKIDENGSARQRGMASVSTNTSH
ncbi:MAG: tetratricopeptide repeat protein [Bdellovibrionota bacterium]